MTLEEAGEILLAGHAVKNCPACEGRGVQLDTRVPLNEKKPSAVYCLPCKGARLVIDYEYVIAWNTVYPDEPMDASKVLKGAIEKLWEGGTMSPKLW
jgi:hypothetical protein